MTKKIALSMDEQEAGFLFNLMDQVNVRGVQNKALMVGLMARIADQVSDEESEEPDLKKKRVRAAKK